MGKNRQIVSRAVLDGIGKELRMRLIDLDNIGVYPLEDGECYVHVEDLESEPEYKPTLTFALLRKTISILNPVWINFDGHSEYYDDIEEVPHEYDNKEVVYITTDGNNELTIEF